MATQVVFQRPASASRSSVKTPSQQLTSPVHQGLADLAKAGYSQRRKFILLQRAATTGHGDRTLRMWNFLEGGVVAKFEGHRGEVTCGRFSVDGKKMVSGSLDKTVRVWETSKKKLLREKSPL